MTTTPKLVVRKAQRQACKACIMLEGLPGAGKSGVALSIAAGLTDNDWNSIWAEDTENKSLDLFVGLNNIDGNKIGQFNVIELDAVTGFSPSTFLYGQQMAIDAGAKVLIKDSISHAWQYDKGILDLLTGAKERTWNKNDSYAAWGDPVIIAEKLNLLRMLRSQHLHIITTVRIKEKLDYEEVDGKKKLVSLGEQQIMQGDIKYEPDLVLRISEPAQTTAGNMKYAKAKVMKTRYAICTLGEEVEISPKFISDLKRYLDEGIDPDVINEETRLEYIKAVQTYITEHPTSKTMWAMLKADAGYKDTLLTDMPLNAIKETYIKLIN